MINPQFPLFASIAGGVFTPILGSGIAGLGVLGAGIAPGVAPVFAPVLASFVGGEIFNLIRQTGAVAQVVLIILLIFSILSWSIILTKWGVHQAGARAERALFAGVPQSAAVAGCCGRL